MRDDFDDPQGYPASSPPFPGTVTAAGIIWIVFGGIILLNMVIVVMVLTVFAAETRGVPGAAGAAAAGAICTMLFVGLFGGAFVFVGVQTVRGTARGTLENAIGSLIFGAILFVLGVVGLGQGFGVQVLMNFVYGAGLLAAGVLALVGRDGYMAWRAFHRPQRPRRPERWEEPDRRRGPPNRGEGPPDYRVQR